MACPAVIASSFVGALDEKDLGDSGLDPGLGEEFIEGFGIFGVEM